MSAEIRTKEDLQAANLFFIEGVRSSLGKMADDMKYNFDKKKKKEEEDKKNGDEKSEKKDEGKDDKEKSEKKDDEKEEKKESALIAELDFILSR